MASRSLYRDDGYVAVTPKAFDTLCVLVEEAGRVVTKDELLRRVWPDALLKKAASPTTFPSCARFSIRFTAATARLRRSAPRLSLHRPVTLRNADAGIAVIADPALSTLMH